MKKLLALIVLLALLVPAAFGEETYPNTSYTLTETSLDLANVSVYAHRDIMEDYDLGTPQTDDTLQYLGLYKDVFGNEPLVPLYASGNMDTIVFENLACLRNGKLILPAPNPNRGAGDPNATLMRIAMNPAFSRLGTPNGLILSPDGKYAAYVDYNKAVRNMQYIFQLIILDVEGGECFYGQTWDIKIGTGKKPAFVVEAAFDENSEYLYYVTYGFQNEYLYSLYRYHLATGKNELLLNHQDDVFCPNLTYLSSSKLIAPKDVTRTNEYGGILEYNKKFLRGWEATVHSLPVTAAVARITRLQANAESGFALAAVTFGNDLGTPVNQLAVINMQKDYEGLDRMLSFNADATTARFVTYDEYMTAGQSEIRYQTSLNACLTPDGTHALALHRVGSETVIRLLNLKTLEVKTVEVPEDFDGQRAAFNSNASADYPLGINMLSDTLVLINTENGVKLYELQ